MTRSLKPFSFYLFLFEKEGFCFFFCLMVIVHQKTGNCFSQSSHTLLPSLLLPILLGGKAEMVPALAFLGICTLGPSLWGTTPRVSCLVGGLVSTMRVDFMSLVGSCPGMALLSGPQASCHPCSAKGFLVRQWAWPPLRSDRRGGREGCDPALQPRRLPLVIAIALQNVT